MGVDLRARYLGLELSSPLVASASPFGATLDTLKELEQAGAAGVVLPSLCEERVEDEATALDDALERGCQSYAEALTYFPELGDYNTQAEAYLFHLEAAKAALSIPVIASVTACTPHGWVRYASSAESAGADALELNVRAGETDATATSDAVEERIFEVVRAVREQVRIPLAVRFGPDHSALAHTAARLVESGADGLVLFNRFVQPDIDLERLAVIPRTCRSSHDDLFPPLRWIAILYGRLDTSLAAAGGIHDPEDVVKVLLVGADVAVAGSGLLSSGPDRLELLLDGLRSWLAEHEYDSVEQLRGSMSQLGCPNPLAFERADPEDAFVSTGAHG